MGYSRTSWEVVVRRKGSLDVVSGWGEDDGGINGVVNYGSRRSRQIGQRHWVKQTYNGWYPEDSFVSSKMPGKEEVVKYATPAYPWRG